MKAIARTALAGMHQEMNFVERRFAELRGLVASVHPVREVKRVAKRIRAKRTAKTPEVSASEEWIQEGYPLALAKAWYPTLSEVGMVGRR